jgi:NitT/TauT family transport system permease protein
MISPCSEKQNRSSPTEERRNKGPCDWARVLGWTVVPLIAMGLWQLAAVRLNQPWIFPPFSRVIEQLAHPTRAHFASGSLLSNTIVSLLRVLIGFVAAVIVGVSMGLLMGTSRTLRGLVEPLIEVLRPLCPIAWLPFAIVLFKLRTLPQLIGMRYTHTIFDEIQLGMVFVLFMGGFFPIFTNTIDGVRGVRRDYLSLARMLGANRFQLFLFVHLAASMPMILTGLRQGIGLCWFVIIAAEMMTGTNSGIGYLLIYAADQSAMDIVIAAMLIIAVIGAGLSFALRGSMRALVGWHGKEV